MGVKELWKNVKPASRIQSLYQFALEFVKTSGTTSNPTIERLPVIGIDMGNYFDECAAATYMAGIHTASSSGPLRPLFFRMCSLLKIPAVFVFVFDGPKRPSLKRGTEVLADRPLWWVDTVKKLVRSFGFHAHQAPGEAEAELAMLNRWGLIDAVVTRDGDALVFGATRVLKTLTKKERRGTDNIERYDISEIFNIQGLDTNRLLLYALAAGGDYDAGLPGCAGGYAYELARSGVGDGLYVDLKTASDDADRALRLKSWKQRTHSAMINGTISPQLSTRLRNTLLNNLPSFPSLKTVDKYVNPATSALFPEYLPGGPNWGAVNQPKPLAIIEFCQNRLDWSNPVALLEVFRSRLWEGLILRRIYSEQCRWNEDGASFGTSAHELSIRSCRLKTRRSKTTAGQLHGRLQVREADVVEVLVGENVFPDAKIDFESIVQVWVPTMMLPTWASKVGVKAVRTGKETKGYGKGKGKAVEKTTRGYRLDPILTAIPSGTSRGGVNLNGTIFIEPTGNVFRDIQALEDAKAQEVREVSSDDGHSSTAVDDDFDTDFDFDGDLRGVEPLGTKRARLPEDDRGEGPSKRRVSTEDVIDLTLSD